MQLNEKELWNTIKTNHNLRSWTGAVISMRVSKEEITSSRNLGLMLHDRQIQPLCGAIQVQKHKKKNSICP